MAIVKVVSVISLRNQRQVVVVRRTAERIRPLVLVHHVLAIPDKVGRDKANRLGLAQSRRQVGVACIHTAFSVSRLLAAGVVGVGRTVAGQLVSVGVIGVALILSKGIINYGISLKEPIPNRIGSFLYVSYFSSIRFIFSHSVKPIK